MLRDPTEAEVAERLGVDTGKLRRIILDSHNATMVSTTYWSPQEEAIVDRELPGKPETQPDYMYSRTQMNAVLSKAMRPLRLRQQQVIVSYYSKEMTMKEIANSMGIQENSV